MSAAKVRILIVEGRFYADLSDELLRGAADAITAVGAEYRGDHRARRAGDPGGHRHRREVSAGGFDGYVALGCVMRGETYHFEIVSNESSRGLMDLATRKRLAIGNGILTVEDEEQAWARARVSEGDKGGGAARACLEVLSIRSRLLGSGK
jgi:6,7-dimethyl-8-ribityllumazine synthase